MASIDLAVNEKRRPGVKGQKKLVPRIDMTPMVDLGFLLIAFFVMTAQLSDPVTMKLNMPNDGPPIKLGESDALTVLLSGNNKAWYYEGGWKEALKNNAVVKSNSSYLQPLRDVIIEKKKRLVSSANKEGRNGLMLLVKADEHASYRNIIDILDEVMINDVKKYALVEMEQEERDWIRKQ
jgi:biopolymer transport protein ExbD